MSHERLDIVYGAAVEQYRKEADPRYERIQYQTDDLGDWCFDEEQPTVVAYDTVGIEGFLMLGQASARLRARGQPGANFLMAVAGVHAETFFEQDGQDYMALHAGYVLDKSGSITVFDTDVPYVASMVDIGLSNCVGLSTAQHIIQTNIPLLRPERSFALEDKWLMKQRLMEFGIPTPNGRACTLDELQQFTADDLPECFVVKPRSGMLGKLVYIFDRGWDDAKMETALGAYEQYDQELLVEEYIDGMPLRSKKVGGDAAWNIRAVVYNGYCGGFARVSPVGQPSNEASGATVMSIPKLMKALSYQSVLDPEELLANITYVANRASLVLPDVAMGLDIMVAANGQPQIVEVNISDFGAFNPNDYSKPDLMLALERMAANITKVALRTPIPEEISEEIIPYSLVDELCYAGNLTAVFSANDKYFTDDNKFNYPKFARSNRKLLCRILDAAEPIIDSGESQYSAMYISGVYRVACAAGNRRLAGRAAKLLGKIEIGALAMQYQAKLEAPDQPES